MDKNVSRIILGVIAASALITSVALMSLHPNQNIEYTCIDGVTYIIATEKKQVVMTVKYNQEGKVVTCGDEK